MLAEHSKSFSLIDCFSVGVDQMQRNFEPMKRHVEDWQRSELTDVPAKVVIYEAFVEGKLEAPKHLAHRSRSVLRTEVRGFSAANDLEPFQRLHLGIQGIGADPAVQGDSQARRVSGDSILADFLTNEGGAGRAADLKPEPPLKFSCGPTHRGQR